MQLVIFAAMPIPVGTSVAVASLWLGRALDLHLPAQSAENT